jgi:predicted exporter
MAPLVAWRYGVRGIIPVLGPPAAAILLTPALLALLGLPFTFFSAIGLVLALSMGVDYAVFCAEDGKAAPVTLLGITLAMSTAVLSFGLLAISEVEGMRTFGATILTAVPLAWILAPLAGAARKKDR